MLGMVLTKLAVDAGHELLWYERRNWGLAFYSWLSSSLYDAKILSHFRVMKLVLFMQYIKCSIHPDALTADTDLATPSIRIRIYLLIYTYVIIHTHDVW